MNSDEYFMHLALKEAKKALKKKEVPVGCILVCKNEVISKGYNLREKNQNPLHHAEIIAINKAARKLKSWRLSDITIYVTLEPCPMCAGAMLQARIKRLVYGTEDPKSGAVKSLMNLTQDKRLNHQIETEGGILREECSTILKDFFRSLRRDG